MSMKFLYNDELLKDRRRSLRSHLTYAEKKIWAYLRLKRLSGYRFLRQYSIGPYILDFYCPKTRLAIEIDGSQHGLDAHRAYDQERSDFLSSFNVTVIRFWNTEIQHQMLCVIQKIEATLAVLPLV